MPAPLPMNFGPLGVVEGSCVECGGRLWFSRAGAWHPPQLFDKCPNVEHLSWVAYLQWRGQGGRPGQVPTWYWTPLLTVGGTA